MSLSSGNGSSGGNNFLSDSEEHTMVILVCVTCVLSIIGSSTILLTYWAFPDIRATSRKMLCYLSLCDLAVAMWNMIGILLGEDILADKEGNARPICVFQSFVTTFFSICSFFWTAAIALFLYMSIVRQNARLMESHMVVVHAVCWGIPFIFVSAAIPHLGYSENFTPGWCWLQQSVTAGSSTSTTRLWVILSGKGWELACYVVTPVLYALIKLHMRREYNSQEGTALITDKAQDAVRGPDRKLVFVPLVFVLLRMWGTIRFFLRVGQSSFRNSFFIVIMQAMGDSSQGFANGVLFCLFTQRVREKLKQLLPSPRKKATLLQVPPYSPLQGFSSRNSTNVSVRSTPHETL